MTRTPPIPPDQRSRTGDHAEEEAHPDRRDLKTGLQSSQEGDADANLDQQGRFANTRQNLTPRRKTQSR